MKDLDVLLLGLSGLQGRLVRNRGVVSYRRVAVGLYAERVRDLQAYERPGLVEHYREWLVVYERLWPLEDV